MLISTIFSQQKYTLLTIVLSIVGLAILPGFLPDYALISLITILMYGILTLSWTMFSGATNNISLATAALFGIGIYCTAVLHKTLPLPVIILISGLLCFAFALLTGLLTLRLKGVYFILFTFGVTALLRNVIQWWEAHITFTVGRHVSGADNEIVYGYILAIFAITLLSSFLLRHSSLGMALQGIGENEDAAEHIGINVTGVKVIVFACSAIFMGATGAVMATRWRYIDAGIAFNPLLSFLPVLMAIFGGTSRLAGPLLGAAFFTVLQEYLITRYPYLYMLLMGVTFIAVILYLPGGLIILAERWWIRVKIRWLMLKARWERWKVQLNEAIRNWQRIRAEWRVGRKQ
ncbi:MAG: branched-chain amino acid ABC transporter permease [Chloroflexota bacterium]